MGKENSFSWKVARKEAGMRLLPFLREKCPEAPSAKAIKRAIDGKCCTVNAQTETFSSRILKENDLVSLSDGAFEKKQTFKKIPVLYEDKELLIINKPAGLVCDAPTLKRHFPAFRGMVHRLDKETTGVLILAKTGEALEKMAALFKERAVRKVYLAIVDKAVLKQEGKIDNYLGKKQSYQGQTIYGAVAAKEGMRALTEWTCLKRGKTASLIRCEPRTGRTHQLRVHMSGMGHPILGDTQYAKRFTCPLRPQRILLHAYRLSFTHPTTSQKIAVQAPIPLDFKHAMRELGL